MHFGMFFLVAGLWAAAAAEPFHFGGDTVYARSYSSYNTVASGADSLYSLGSALDAVNESGNDIVFDSVVLCEALDTGWTAVYGAVLGGTLYGVFSDTIVSDAQRLPDPLALELPWSIPPDTVSVALRAFGGPFAIPAFDTLKFCGLFYDQPIPVAKQAVLAQGVVPISLHLAFYSGGDCDTIVVMTLFNTDVSALVNSTASPVATAARTPQRTINLLGREIGRSSSAAAVARPAGILIDVGGAGMRKRMGVP